MPKIATIFAGLQGAGKTTLYYLLQEQKINLGYHINTDESKPRRTRCRATFNK